MYECIYIIMSHGKRNDYFIEEVDAGTVRTLLKITSTSSLEGCVHKKELHEHARWEHRTMLSEAHRRAYTKPPRLCAITFSCVSVLEGWALFLRTSLVKLCKLCLL